MAAAAAAPRRTAWRVNASASSKRVDNPIREIVDQMRLEPNPAKPTISLALGPLRMGAAWRARLPD